MPKTEEIAVKEKTVSSRFVGAIKNEFLSTAGELPVKFDEKKKRLAQHLFIGIDAAMKIAEKRRLDKGPKNNPAIVWANVNMELLAIDAMYRIELGLDALIPNHISTIPYFNNRTKKYDIDLRIGYVGKDYYRRAMAVEIPVDIRYELVYENDTFEVTKKSFNNNVESYKLDIKNPFDRGPVVGGFGYIIFENHAKNQLVIVSEKEFLEYRSYSKTDKFWGKHPDIMRYKTLVHRTTDKLRVDPDKVNSYFAIIEAESVGSDVGTETKLKEDVVEYANKDVIDIESDPDPDDLELENDDISSNLEMSDDEKAEIEAAEGAENAGGGPGF